MRGTRLSESLWVLLTAALALGGCVGTKQIWVRDGIPKEQVTQDDARCAYNAELACGTQFQLSEDAAKVRQSHYDKLHSTCMQSLGYSQQTIEVY